VRGEGRRRLEARNQGIHGGAQHRASNTMGLKNMPNHPSRFTRLLTLTSVPLRSFFALLGTILLPPRISYYIPPDI